jgi:uncharacterized protein YjbJ (UPF0337 family)
MNTDQASGKFDQMKGKVKQGVGEAVGNQKLANEGVVDQVKGSAKEVYGNVKDAVHHNVEAARHDREAEANQARANIVDNVDAARERANASVDSQRRKAS